MKPSFPRGPLFGVAALIAITVGGAGVTRLRGGPTAVPTTVAAIVRDVTFADRQDGALIVTDAHDRAVVGVVEPGTNGFLRATMRGLARQRMQQGIGRDAAFRLTAWQDGRLTLEDPTTNRRLDLEAFGPTNAAAFAIFLTRERTQP